MQLRVEYYLSIDELKQNLRHIITWLKIDCNLFCSSNKQIPGNFDAKAACGAICYCDN